MQILPGIPQGFMIASWRMLVDARQGPLFLRFTAYPDSFLDSLENPAYATEFSAPEGRIFLLPSFRGSQGVGDRSVFLVFQPRKIGRL